MRERILVPLDGSRVGESALPFVWGLMSKLAPEVEREVVLLQAVTPAKIMLAEAAIPDVAAETAITEQNVKIAREYLESVRKDWEGRGVAFSTKVVLGEAAEQIVEMSEDMDVDLIAMSTHGRSGLGRLAFGSVTERVLHAKGRIPIVVIRADET